MMELASVMAELRKKGNPLRVKAYGPHGAPENLFGVGVADLKGIAKRIKGEQELAYDLYDTGNADAMYLAGLVANGALMSKRKLDTWAKRASWQMVSEHTVPGVAVESQCARELALAWIESTKESVASSGWCTLAGMVAVTPDEQLDLPEIKALLKTVEKEIDSAPNRVRYTMNGFVIAVGSHVAPLAKEAKATATKLGKVQVDMNGTTCKVPLATERIAKVEQSGRTGKKRKSIKS